MGKYLKKAFFTNNVLAVYFNGHMMRLPPHMSKLGPKKRLGYYRPDKCKIESLDQQPGAAGFSAPGYDGVRSAKSTLIGSNDSLWGDRNPTHRSFSKNVFFLSNKLSL